MPLFSTAQIWYILRMIIASFCGILIGLERKNRSKEAGVRTHCVVACASALMMIISKYSCGDMSDSRRWSCNWRRTLRCRYCGIDHYNPGTNPSAQKFQMAEKL